MIVSRAGGVICVVSWTDLAVGRVGLEPSYRQKLHRNKRGDREKEEESNKKEKRKRAG
jgi:hypothetical protein